MSARDGFGVRQRNTRTRTSQTARDRGVEKWREKFETNVCEKRGDDNAGRTVTATTTVTKTTTTTVTSALEESLRTRCDLLSVCLLVCRADADRSRGTVAGALHYTLTVGRSSSRARRGTLPGTIRRTRRRRVDARRRRHRRGSRSPLSAKKIGRKNYVSIRNNNNCPCPWRTVCAPVSTRYRISYNLRNRVSVPLAVRAFIRRPVNHRYRVTVIIFFALSKPISS